MIDKQKTRLIKKISVNLLLDALSVAFSWFIAIILSKNTNLHVCLHSIGFWLFFAGNIILLWALNLFLGLYNKLIKYLDLSDAVKVLFIGTVSAIYSLIATWVLKELQVEWFFIDVLFSYFFIFAFRFSYKVYSIVLLSLLNNSKKKTATRAMIIGAGEAGSLVIKDLKYTDKTNINIVCALDDDKAKIGQYINGVKIAGSVSEVEKIAIDYNVEEIIIAIASISKKRLSEIIRQCQKTSCKIKVLPAVYQLANGEVSISRLKEVEIEDLLGREQVKVSIEEIDEYLEGKVVLVSGGGGSIGSELCRQIAKRNPKRLIIIDIYENNAYEIQQELKRKHPNLDLVVLVASVRDTKRMDSIFEKYRPQIVFHAAAHKHVPLMEESPNEAVKNNIGGTYKISDASGRFGAERFVMISTDKAVNPTNVMGATKRACEMIIQTMNKKYKTKYVAVRFGNVLGSNGSVIPLFKKQISEGGPITLTHKDIVRYFMTIPEAVSLVLQAGAYANGGEIYVLDMGEPVKIYDLAVNLIKLSGLEPYKDIDIVITGLRPGEKLFEERLMDVEGLKKTANNRISVAEPLDFDPDTLFKSVLDIYALARTETQEIKEALSKLVPTYKIDKKQYSNVKIEI